jgi:hypothetical protein
MDLGGTLRVLALRPGSTPVTDDSTRPRPPGSEDSTRGFIPNPVAVVS